MSAEPTVTCMTCRKIRRCEWHKRADHPPTAAKKWLQRRCPKKREACDLRYTAGILIGGRIRGMSDDLAALIGRKS